MGFVHIGKLLELPFFRSLNANIYDVSRIVTKDKKGRFEQIFAPNVGWVIRAVQGHTIDGVKDEHMLKKVEITDFQLENCYHATTLENIFGILREGLKRGKRNHIHFGLPNSRSGVRPNMDCFFKLDMEECGRRGLEFFRAENGIIVSKGIGGRVPKECLLGPFWIKRGEGGRYEE